MMRGVRIRRAHIGAAVLLLCALGAPVSSHAQVRVVAFGDSNTYGMNMAREQSYPAQLEAMLKAKGHNIRVDNRGVPGATAADGVSRVDSAVPAGTRVAIVLFGINDVRRGVSATAFESSMTEILGRIKARGTRIVLCYRPHPRLAGEFQAAYKRAGSKFGAAICNFRAGVPKTGYQADGHENAEGNTAVARNLMRVVEPMIR